MGDRKEIVCSTSLEEIQALVSVTERMLELAQAQEWEQVIQLESERQPQLEAFFTSLSDEVRQSCADQLRQAIERIQHLDQGIMTLGGELKENAARMLLKNQSARKALKAYKNNAAL